MSGLNRYANCPASPVTSEGCADPSGPGARVGTVYHRIMEYATEIGVAEAAKLVRSECLAVGVDPDAIQELLREFPFDPSGEGNMAEVEVALEFGGQHLKGHIDLLRSEEPREVIDYKTGRRPAEEPEPGEHLQLLGYGIGAWELLGLGEDDELTLSLAFPRLGDRGWSQHTLSYEGMLDAREVIDRVVSTAVEQYGKPISERDYQSGAWCQYCPGRGTCPALRTDLRGAAGLAGEREITRENALKLHGLGKSMRKFERALSKGLAELVDQGGPIPQGDSKALEFRTHTRRPPISLGHVQGALRRCEVPEAQAEAVVNTLEMREGTESRRLDIYKVLEGER